MYYIINGSPRSNGNTATLLHSAENGIKSVGKEVEWIELNKLNFKGCISCFACKQVDEKFKNHCIQKDDLSLMLEKLLQTGADMCLSRKKPTLQKLLQGRS